jgi:hypothetical protein
MTETGDEHTQYNNPEVDGPHFYGEGSEYLPADIRVLAFPDENVQAIAWMSNLGVSISSCSAWLSGPVVFLFTVALYLVPPITVAPPVATLAIGFMFALYICFIFWPWPPGTNNYWILCPSDLTIVVKRRSLYLFSCCKWNYSVTKIPLPSIVDCYASTSCCHTTLCVSTSSQPGKPGQKFEMVACAPQWLVIKVHNQRSLIQDGTGTQSTTPTDTDSVMSSDPPGLRKRLYDAMIRSAGTGLVGDQAVTRTPLATATFTTPYAGEPVLMAPPQPIDSTNLEYADMIVIRAFASLYSSALAWSDADVPTNRLDEDERDIEAP